MLGEKCQAQETDLPFPNQCYIQKARIPCFLPSTSLPQFPEPQQPAYPLQRSVSHAKDPCFQGILPLPAQPNPNLQSQNASHTRLQAVSGLSVPKGLNGISSPLPTESIVHIFNEKPLSASLCISSPTSILPVTHTPITYLLLHSRKLFSRKW